MKNKPHTTIFLALILLFSGESFAQATVKINFLNTVNGQPVVLHDSTYTNPFGETYSLRKLRYYISHPGFNNYSIADENFFLIDQAKNTSIEITVKEGSYDSLHFLLGVDSARNNSGAQTGALDPMNDMFWTWNTGYVMFKMDGTSSASTADRQRIEHHVGGYRFGQNTATRVSLPVKLKLEKGDKKEITIEMDLNRYWDGEYKIKLAAEPVCTSPGDMAVRFSKNFKNLFSVKEIN